MSSLRQCLLPTSISSAYRGRCLALRSIRKKGFSSQAEVTSTGARRESSSGELVPHDPGQLSQLPHNSGSPEPESDAESDDTHCYSDEEGDLVIDENDWTLLTQE